MNDLVIAHHNISQDAAGRFSLNDLHRSSGGNRKDQPQYWLANKKTRELIVEASDTGIPVSVIRGGRDQGTYVSDDLVIAYAAWISPKFHLQVIRAYKRQNGVALRGIEKLHNRQIAYEKKNAAAKQKGSIAGSWLAQWRHVKKTLQAEKKLLDEAIQPRLFAEET